MLILIPSRPRDDPDMDAPPVATYGLTHLALAVADVSRAFGFHESVFGMVAVYCDENFFLVQQSELVPGEPYVFAPHRDGHLLEIRYELPTSVDPS